MKNQKPIFIMSADMLDGVAKGTIQATEERLALDTLLEKAGVDTNVWYVDTWKVRKSEWDVHMKLQERSTEGKIIKDKPHKATNYGFYVEANLKRKVPVLNIDAFKEMLIEEISRKVKVPDLSKGFRMKHTSDNLFVPGIVDPHLGKLAWALESSQNYDVKIALDFHRRAMKHLIGLSLPYKPIASLLISGQDTFNYDFSEPYPQTTAGTPQEADVRWQKMFRLGVQLWIEYVEYCKQFGPVHILNIAGNHAYQMEFFLGEVLHERFKNDSLVEIDNTPRSRKYFKWGKNMIGVAHGKWETPASVHHMMSVDDKKMWGNTSYRYFYLGDKHHEEEIMKIVRGEKKGTGLIKRAEDYRGVMIEILPTLSQIDKYEFTRGFVGTIKGSRAMIHSKSMGRIAKMGFNL